MAQRAGLSGILIASSIAGCADLIDLERGILDNGSGSSSPDGGGSGGDADASTASGSTSSSTSSSAAGGGDGGAGGVGGAGGGCGVSSGGGSLCGGAEWAHWTPSEEKCFSLTAEVAHDSTTNLEWQRSPPVETFSQADALLYCNALEIASHTDWRLPTRIELTSIINYVVKSPAAYLDSFPDTTSEAFWTASSYALDTSSAWAVNFTDGSVIPQGKDNALRLRCVR